MSSTRFDSDLELIQIGFYRLAGFVRVTLRQIVENDSGDAGHGSDQYPNLTAGTALMAVILLVDDDRFVCQSIDWLLRNMGHDTLLAGDQAGALVHLMGPGHIDALFVDIRLHTLAFGGYDIADRANGMRPGLRIMYTSGTPLTDDMTSRFVGGASFLRKPYSVEQLQRSVTEMLH